MSPEILCPFLSAGEEEKYIEVKYNLTK